MDITFLNQVERVLRLPGNLPDGKLTEMAIVLDYQVPQEILGKNSEEIALALKRKNEQFRNVRCNVVKWASDTCIQQESISLSLLSIGRGLEDYDTLPKGEKHMDLLAAYLKKYCARSKLIILLGGDGIEEGDAKLLSESMNPFLKRKLLQIRISYTGGENIESE